MHDFWKTQIYRVQARKNDTGGVLLLGCVPGETVRKSRIDQAEGRSSYRCSRRSDVMNWWIMIEN